jgi:hypothetical protein
LHFGAAVASAIEASPSLELMPTRHQADTCDEEMSLRTVFPFLIRKGGALLTRDACSALYHDLNRDMSGAFPHAGAEDHAILATRCLIGQPVALVQNGTPTAALRLSASARLAAENWSQDQAVAHQNMKRERERIAIVLRKIECLLKRENQ